MDAGISATHAPPLRQPAAPTRQYPVGAEPQENGAGVHFRVWAPAVENVSVELIRSGGDAGVGRVVPLEPEGNGYFSGTVTEARAGQLYRFRLPGGSFPDPASRRQPRGPHGPSEIVDNRFQWTDRDWMGRAAGRDLVIYELHLGTFTHEGTWRAAQEQLEELRRLGVTTIEIMPIADFPGDYGWGYDGVNLFAPCRLYGSPDDVRSFVDQAHALGLMVILDVVYNHFGPDGNYLNQFSPHYFTRGRFCEWGDAIDFDGEHSAGVREFFVANACYWIREFHFDGLRFDATQQIFDDSPRHILAEIAAAVRSTAGKRTLYLVAENEVQDGRLVRAPVDGGYGLDAIWNDDWHHAAVVAATGRAEAYYSGYRGSAQEFISAIKYGFLYQGQWFPWQQMRRGHPSLDLPADRFVIFLQNHDQVANSLRGQRLHQLTSPAQLRALTALTLLAPGAVMLFQGQEFASSAPFLFFADHERDLAEKIHHGRRGFLEQFRSIATPEAAEVQRPPHDRRTFEACRLDFSEREKHADVYRLHADLLKLRREDSALARPTKVDGAVLGPSILAIRYFASDGEDRLLVVNLESDSTFNPGPEPLLAPPHREGWRMLWSSESPVYHGAGTPHLETRRGWLLPGRSAVLLAPDSNPEVPDAKLSEKN